MAAAAERPPAPELVVVAPPELERDAERLRALDRERLWSAVELVGLEDPGPPIRVELAGEDSPQAQAVHSWVAGYARGAAGPIVLFPARTPSYPSRSLEELLHHEVAHVLIARASHGRPLPRWFHEGVAMAAGSAWGIEDRSRFALQMLRGGPLQLAGLERQFPGGGAGAARAYAVSGAFVRDLRRRHGPAVTGEVLRRVGGGASFDSAFRAATGETLAAAEEAFWRRQTFWQRWVPFLSSSAAVWIGVTLLALWAFKRRRERDAALAEKWAAEEAARLEAARRRAELSPPAGSGNGSPWVN